MPTSSGYWKKQTPKKHFSKTPSSSLYSSRPHCWKSTFFFYPVKEKQEVCACRQAHGLTSETWHCHVMRSRVRNNTPAKPTSLQDAQGRGGKLLSFTWDIEKREKSVTRNGHTSAKKDSPRFRATAMITARENSSKMTSSSTLLSYLFWLGLSTSPAVVF